VLAYWNDNEEPVHGGPRRTKLSSGFGVKLHVLRKPDPGATMIFSFMAT
jgi:hypothetical protein